MKNVTEFYEKQRMSLWIAATGISSLIAILIIFVVTKKLVLAHVPVHASIILLFIVIYVFFIMQTIINENGIYVKIFPMKWKFISWDEVEKAYIRKYNPVLEYGGWGYKSALFKIKGMKINLLRNSFKKNIACNMRGNTGLQLELKNGNRVLIGTQKPQEIEEILRNKKRMQMTRRLS
ncbi:MAG: hypothetical protein LBD80_03025 [Tannerella sp.]|jgi:hypothetical protein|nr:hypothetical protein [Tannerella sp.]